MKYCNSTDSLDSAVDIAISYGLDDRGGLSSSPGGVKNLFSPRRPDRLWSPASLLSNG
jgi:hypothetical protein